MSAAFLDEMRLCFESAIDAGTPRNDALLDIAGTKVLLRFAGQGLADAILPAVAPLHSDANVEPEMTVELWDSATAGIKPPTPPWGTWDAGRLGAIRGHNEGGHRTVVDPATGILTIADLKRGLAVVWMKSADHLPIWWRARPLRPLIDWISSRPGRHMIHAGAVGVGRRGVLLAGSGKAGKSTTAAACVEADMAFAGDDYVLLSEGEELSAHSLYSTLKLDERSLAALPGLARIVTETEAGEKAVLDVAVRKPPVLCPELGVEAIVMPAICGVTKPQLHPVSAGAAARALAPSTIFQAPDGSEGALRLIAELVRRVPAYELRMGADLRDVPERIGSLVATAA